MTARSEIPHEPRTTRIEREHFVLHAPYEWHALRSDDPLELEFCNQQLPEQLLITIRSFAKAVGYDDLDSAVRRLSDFRLEAVSGLSKSKFVGSPVTFQRANDQVEARCVGIDPLNGVRIAWVVRGTKEKVVTVALTRYSLEGNDVAFATYANAIFDLLQVK